MLLGPRAGAGEYAVGVLDDGGRDFFAVAARPASVAKAVARAPGVSLDRSQSMLAAKLARHYDGELCRHHLFICSG